MNAVPPVPRAPAARPELSLPSGDAVPSFVERTERPRSLISPAARKAVRQRMLLFRQAALDRIATLTGASAADLQSYRRELKESDLTDVLVQRGAGLAFTQELPQGALLYLLVRAARPRRVLETGVRPGYSTAWILAALEANGGGALTSLGPGPTTGRSHGVHEYGVGQLVPPALRSRWTLALGNTPDRLRELLAELRPIDLFFSDNGPDVDRTRSELHGAWESLAPNGLLVAHHVEASPAWADFCRLQGMPTQILDAGPPPMGVLAMRAAARR
jgi:predicted O-methyltransferase YrrM